MELALVLLGGLAIGTAAGWLFRASRARAEVEAARGATLAAAEQHKLEALEKLREESSRRASFEALATTRIPELEKELVLRERQIASQQDRFLQAASERDTLQARLESERKGFEEKLKVLEDAKKALTDTFNAISGAALRSNSEEFLKLARASLGQYQEGAKNDLALREQAIAQLVEPMRQALEKFETRVQTLEVAREGAYKGLVEQVHQLLDTGRALRSETSNLVQALRSPTVRGQWGEIQLRRVVEMAGMLNYCDFVEQETVAGEERTLRPDLIVKLPAGKTIVVDAKAPVAHFLDAMAEQDEAARGAKLKAYAQLVRNRITELGRKSYWDQFEHTPELVVMFLPGDHFHSAALEQDPSLLEFGVEQKVLVATPINLIGLLRAVAYGWRQEAIAQNAKEISSLGAELYKRISDFGGHWVDLSKHLGRTVDAFNGAVGSLESRVLVTARKFKELGAVASSVDIDPVPPVEKTPRPVGQFRVLDLDLGTRGRGQESDH